MTVIRTSGRIGDMEEQEVSTADLAAGIPRWVGALAIRQCVKAGEHERDYPSACREHLLEALRLAAWLAGEDSDAQR